MYEQEIQKGTIKSFNWQQYSSLNALNSYDPVYVPETMKKEELISIQRYAIRSFYLRPIMIIKHLKKIRSFNDIKKYFNVLLAIIQATMWKIRK